MISEIHSDAAREAAIKVRRLFGKDSFSIGVILGTGWAEHLPFEIENSISLSKLPGFENLPKLKGHPRELVFAKVNNKNVLILRGRIHLNERIEKGNILDLVRLQIAFMRSLKCNKFILTGSVGGLQDNISTGDVIVINDLITLFAPPSPLVGGEFICPTAALDAKLNQLAIKVGQSILKKRIKSGTHVMVPGPNFETIKDKKILAACGGDIVGMSILPEMQIVALHNAKAIGLGFVTNGLEHCTHEENIARVKESSKRLQKYLRALIEKV